MSKKTFIALAALVIALPTAASAQIGIGARAGTLGVGGELALGLGSRLQIRGGIGTVPAEPTFTFSDMEYTVNPPSTIWNVGVDLFPFGGGFHISAGLLNRPRYEIEMNGTGSQEVGGQTYNGQIHLVGFLENEKETAPYVGIGFGKVSSRGIGLFFDLGASPMGEPNIEFTTADCFITGSGPAGGQRCPASNGQPDPNGTAFRASANAEANNAEADVGQFLKWHPIVQIGLKVGFGK